MSNFIAVADASPKLGEKLLKIFISQYENLNMLLFHNSDSKLFYYQDIL